MENLKTSDESPECCRRSFGASLRDSAKKVLENPKLAPRSVRNERLSLCHKCDHYLEDTDQCDICYCILGIKASFANMRCDIDKWGEWTD
jgi:hypothetical protein